MEDLIVHAPLLFDDRPSQSEPPLPPAPSGEPKPKYDYGSSYTQVATLPPRLHDGQDFTPSLPPRPGQSIHPSRRTNQQSSSRAQEVSESDVVQATLSGANAEYPPKEHHLEPQRPQVGQPDRHGSPISPILPVASDVTVTDDTSARSGKDEHTDSRGSFEAFPDVPSPKTPETFATAPQGSPRTPSSSRSSTAHEESPAAHMGGSDVGILD